MINCVIIDDEKPARDTLGLMLSRFFPEKVTVTGMAESLKEGILTIQKNNPDLVFLDIEMPDENGFKIFNYFKQPRFSVIFTTAYTEYAIKAIKVAALDYILKPVSINSLKETLDLYEKRHLSAVPVDQISRLINALNPSTLGVSKVALPIFNGFQLEKIDSILYCKADQNYTKVYISGGVELLISKPLNAVEKLLPADIFFRIHKSHLVNLNYIKTYNKSEGFHIILEDGTKLDVASRRNEEFVKLLTQMWGRGK